ncbi:hypothetical protein ACTXHA_03930 [Burkholderia cenocepacia]
MNADKHRTDALSNEQRAAIKAAIDMLEIRAWSGDLHSAAHLRTLLAAFSVMRAEAMSGDERDASRWQTLMRNGEPVAEIVGRERRIVPGESVGASRTMTYENWVNREVRFRWWDREGEPRTLTEVVDADRAEETQ